MTNEVDDSMLEGQIRDYSSEDNTEGTAVIVGYIAFILIMLCVFVCVAAYMFNDLRKKDAQLPADQKVFGPVCMVGYAIFCLFTPICFLMFYYCVTVGIINEKQQIIVRSRQDVQGQQGIPVATAAPVQTQNNQVMLS